MNKGTCDRYCMEPERGIPNFGDSPRCRWRGGLGPELLYFGLHLAQGSCLRMHSRAPFAATL